MKTTKPKKAAAVAKKKSPKDILERIKTISDVLRELGTKDKEVIAYNNLKDLFDADNHIVNYLLAVLIVKALNEKREPNWQDGNYKYILYFWMSSSGFRFSVFDSWVSYSGVGSRLCFLERRLAEHAVAQPEFLNVFKNFMTIKK